MHPKPKRSLSQNFLFDKNIQNKIVQACGFDSRDTVLEIGAGRGELTRLIADNVAHLYAVEIDKELVGPLENYFKDNPRVKIISQDILLFNLNRRFRNLNKKIRVIGNIPYRITTPIIQYLIKYREKIEVIFLTVQKEFARRIQALPGSKDYSSFSCFVQYYTIPRILFTIKNNSFFPAPKVDSCFLSLQIRKEPAVKTDNERFLFKIIRTAFNQRRKTLRNSLKGVIPAQKLDKLLTRYQIDRNTRPELLSLQDFANLSKL